MYMIMILGDWKKVFIKLLNAPKSNSQRRDFFIVDD